MLRLDVRSRETVDSSRLPLRDRLGILFRLQRYTLPFWDKILLRAISTLIVSLLSVVPALLTPYVLDDALPNGDYGLLLRIAAIGLVVYAVWRVLGIISGTERTDGGAFPCNVMAAYTIPKIAVRIRQDFLRHVQLLSMGFFTSRPVGEHMFRSTLDCDDAAYVASEFMPKSIAAVQRIAVLLFALQGFGYWLLWPIALYLVLFFAAKHALSTAVRKWDRRYRVETQRLDAVCREVLYPWKLVKAYTMGRTVRNWYGAQACRSARTLFMRGLLTQFDSYFTFVAIGVFIAMLNVLTGWFVVRGTLTLGEYSAIAGLVAMLVRPFEEMISTFQLFRQKLVPAERLLETLAVTPTVSDPREPKTLPTARGRIEFRNVHFSYGNGIEVLHEVSLVAEPGEKIAIVGPTGAGKSTILSLIVRLYDVDKGEVLVDGIDCREVRQEGLRDRMALVPQSLVVFPGTIRDNILFGHPRAGVGAVRAAARLARVDEFASQLPEGLDALLAEGGSLSGGQRQRLCIARALVRDAAVLLLDEATSALDPVTEREVVERIDEAYASRTRIVVAHNVFSARTADRIYVLEKGRVVEVGTHEELMRAAGSYARLWAKQTPCPVSVPVSAASGSSATQNGTEAGVT